MWSCQVQLSAPGLGGCCCISRLTVRGSAELPSPAQKHAPCPTCPVCSPGPAGLCLVPAAACCSSHRSPGTEPGAQSTSPELQAFITKPLHFPSNHLHLLSKVYVCLWIGKRKIKRYLNIVITLWKNLTEYKKKKQNFIDIGSHRNYNKKSAEFYQELSRIITCFFHPDLCSC